MVLAGFDDFAIDFGSRQLLRGGRAVHLGPKAFELLVLLFNARPRAFSKAQIQAHLWPRTFVSESSLTSLVNELRGTLGDSARRPRFIRTVYGFGYAFCGAATDTEEPVSPGVPSPPRLRLFLEDREIALREGENLLGRMDDAVAWLESPTVSRRHARIVVRQGRVTLEDLGSKNGTYLRDLRLKSAVPLADRDEIRLGDVRMTFRVLPPGSTQTGMDR